MKKKHAVFLLLIFFTTFLPVFANVNSVWALIYQRSDDIFQKQMLLTRLKDMDDRSLNHIYKDSLSDLIKNSRYYLQGNYNVKNAYFNVLQMLADLIGKNKVIEAKSDLWQIVEEFDSPYVESAAITALGNLEAEEFTTHVADLLEKTVSGVLKFDNNQQKESIIAASIYMLERSNASEGFRAMFLASQQGFSQKIDHRIKHALKNLAANFPDEFSLLMDSNFLVIDDKIALLHLCADLFLDGFFSNNEINSINTAEIINPQPLHAVAMAALEYYQYIEPVDYEEERKIYRLQALAVSLADKVDFDDPQLLPILQTIFDNSLVNYYDNQKSQISEQLVFIGALGGYNDNEQAAAILEDILNTFNDRVQASSVDVRIVNTLLQSIAECGHPSLQAETLRTSLNNYWSNSVLRKANQVLKEIM